MKKIILVVDDEKNVCESINEIFMDDYTVLSAMTVENARKIVTKQKIDLLILDYMLPDASGLEYLEEIKKQYPDLPVIFSTAYGCEGVAGTVTSYKNVVYLKKFYDVDTLSRAVKVLLGEESAGPININNTIITNKDDIILNNVLEYIKEGVSKELTVQSIAKHFNLTVAELNKIFSRKFEISVKEYISRYRIKRGAELLERTDESIERIAKRVGLKSKTTFHELFLKYKKMTPQQYKDKNQIIKNGLPS